jgi:hypothetical protein
LKKLQNALWKKGSKPEEIDLLQSIYGIKPKEVQNKSSIPNYNSSPQESSFDSFSRDISSIRISYRRLT